MDSNNDQEMDNRKRKIDGQDPPSPTSRPSTSSAAAADHLLPDEYDPTFLTLTLATASSHPPPPPPPPPPATLTFSTAPSHHPPPPPPSSPATLTLSTTPSHHPPPPSATLTLSTVSSHHPPPPRPPSPATLTLSTAPGHPLRRPHHRRHPPSHSPPNPHPAPSPTSSPAAPAPTRRPKPRRREAPPLPGPRPGQTRNHPPPYPWSSNHRATVLSLERLDAKHITSVSGAVECKRCDRRYEIHFDLHRKFDEVRSFIAAWKHNMRQRAPRPWVSPSFPRCRFCDHDGSVRPRIADKKRHINWLFLLLGQMLGCCTLEQLKYFCKHTRNHRTGAKDRVLYLTYMGLCKQLEPKGPVDFTI